MINTRNKLKGLNKKLSDKQKELMYILYESSLQEDTCNDNIEQIKREIIILDYLIESWLTIYHYDMSEFWKN